MTKPHFCKCALVESCNINTHPSKDIQKLINSLVDVMREFDDNNGSMSLIIVKTIHRDGVFTSITRNMGD